MRKITVIVSATNMKHTFETDVTTLGQLKELLSAKGINTNNQAYYEGVSKTELVNDDSVLPTNIPYKGRIENNLVIMMTTANKKIESGSSRKELYVIINQNNLKDAIREHAGIPYTNVSTDNLEELVDELLDSNKNTDCNEDEGDGLCRECYLRQLAAYSVVSTAALLSEITGESKYTEACNLTEEACRIIEASEGNHKEKDASGFTKEELEEMFN